jgi:superfamily II helicase
VKGWISIIKKVKALLEEKDLSSPIPKFNSSRSKKEIEEENEANSKHKALFIAKNIIRAMKLMHFARQYGLSCSVYHSGLKAKAQRILLEKFHDVILIPVLNNSYIG